MAQQKQDRIWLSARTALGPIPHKQLLAFAGAFHVILTPYQESGEIAAVHSIIGVGGGTRAFFVIRLPDWAERERSQLQIVPEIGARLASVPGVQASTRSTNSLNIRGAGQGLQFAVTGNDVAAMTNAADALLAAMGQDDAFLNPQLSNDTVHAQYEVRVGPDMASVFGLTEAAITQTVSAMIQAKSAVTVFGDNSVTDVNIAPGGPPIDDPTDLDSILSRLPGGAYVPLSVAATLEPVVSQPTRERQGELLVVSALADLAEGVDLGTAMDRLSTIAAKTLPDGMGLIFTGEAATLSDSQIGLVMLIGVMAKNGILIVEVANRLRVAGQDIDSAIRDALRLRIRPALMTMVSTAFGGLPLILTSGAGAEARIAVGWVIVGGLGFATAITLFPTPVFYCWIAVWGAVPGMASKRLRREIGAMPALANQAN